MYPDDPLITDADLYDEIGNDFADIAGVRGRAGSFVGTLTGWTLAGTGVDFVAAGILPGMVVGLVEHGAANPEGGGLDRTTFAVITAVATTSLTLRPAVAFGGLPPAAGKYDASILTAIGTIRRVSQDVRRRLKIVDTGSDADLAEVCRYLVAAKLYRIGYPERTETEKTDAMADFAAKKAGFYKKAKDYEALAKDAMARLDLVYAPGSGGSPVVVPIDEAEAIDATIPAHHRRYL